MTDQAKDVDYGHWKLWRVLIIFIAATLIPYWYVLWLLPVRVLWPALKDSYKAFFRGLGWVLSNEHRFLGDSLKSVPDLWGQPKEWSLAESKRKGHNPVGILVVAGAVSLTCLSATAYSLWVLAI